METLLIIILAYSLIAVLGLAVVVRFAYVSSPRRISQKRSTYVSH